LGLWREIKKKGKTIREFPLKVMGPDPNIDAMRDTVSELEVVIGKDLEKCMVIKRG
jgi:hypothetical protein